jgi:cysteine synthase
VFFEAIIMPDDVALEKVKALEALGADVERVRPASIVDKKQASPPVDFPKYRRLQVLLFL